MTMLSFLTYEYEYHYWANERILRAAEGLSSEQFATPVLPHHNGLRGTLVHTLSADWMWLSRWQGTSPTAMLREQDFPDLASIRERWRHEEGNMRAFLSTLRDEDPLRVVRYTNTKGKAFAFPLWQLMLHVVNHGTQHRSEAAAMLTELGHSPGDLDMVLFLQQK